ncbi:MAG: IS30 family transposase [Crenarchaeota archaeon]|jgi:IS30 family transposase|nr:IS30 family transposase [Thermoproteota archaeon]
MKKIHHLTLQERQAIQTAIEEGKTKAEIGRLLGKDPCGISREIIKHREVKERNTYNRPILCAKRKDCKIRKCFRSCKEFEEPACVRRDRLPGVCNGCEKRTKCPLDKYFYHAARADSRYREELVSCREGINIEQSDRNLIGETISPLLKQGQSVYQILSNHPELQISDRTLYRYIETGVFRKFGVNNFSLKEQVNRKQFQEKYKKRKEPANYNGRKYADYLEFIQQNPDITAVEMDTVYNQQSGPYIQTFMFPGMQFMVGRLHFEKTSESMSSALNHYQGQLGDALFSKLFKLLLTDRGSEFEKANLFEIGVDGKQRLNIFYCDAMQSAQKPHVENNHNFVRDVIPNGKPLDRLTQDSVNIMFSHINSTPRRALHGKTPYELFTFYFGNCVAEKLGIIEIQKDDVILKPSLIF